MGIPREYERFELLRALRRIRLVHILAALALAAALPASELPVFELQCPQTGGGNGFLVADWRPGQNGVLLVTALHVVHTCSSLRLVKVNCDADLTSEFKWKAPAGTPVLSWPEFDLAAVQVPDDHLESLAGSAAGFLAPAHAKPAIDSTVEILGTSQFLGCPSIPGNHVLYHTTAGENATHVAARARAPGLEVKDVLGSLSGDAPIVLYFGPAYKGASGAAVVSERRSGAVVAFHHAGYEDWPVSWGISLAGLGPRLGEPQLSHLGDDDWPVFIPPSLQQAGFKSLPNSVQELAKRHQDDQLAAYESADALLSGFADHGREVLARYERHLPQAVDHPEVAVRSMGEAVRGYNPLRDELYQSSETSRAKIHAYWSPGLASEFESLVALAKSAHSDDPNILGGTNGLYFLNERVNKPINAILSGDVRGSEQRAAVHANAQEALEGIRAYALPLLNQLTDRIPPFLRSLERGITQVAVR